MVIASANMSDSTMASRCAFAHSVLGWPQTAWEPLDHHLNETATLAEHYARGLAAPAWGAWLGRWHDLGKYAPAFQDYLRQTADPDAAAEDSRAGRVDHSTFGAQHAVATVGGHVGLVLAFCIAGHHAGLPDADSDEERSRGATLQGRLRKSVPAVVLPSGPPLPPRPTLPFRLQPGTVGFQVAFFTRMLFFMSSGCGSHSYGRVLPPGCGRRAEPGQAFLRCVAGGPACLSAGQAGLGRRRARSTACGRKCWPTVWPRPRWPRVSLP